MEIWPCDQHGSKHLTGNIVSILYKSHKEYRIINSFIGEKKKAERGKKEAFEKLGS